MARYDTYLAGDDRKLEEQELGFKGFNDRLRPDQIGPGLLQKSENGRLDLNGQWQSRKGVQNRLSPFAVSGTALRLPTSDEITAGTIMLLSHTVTAATHISGTVTLTTNEAHNLSVGDTIEVNDIVSNNVDVNGSHELISGTTGSTLVYSLAGDSTLTVSEGANLGITTSTGPQFSPLDFTTGTPPKFLPCAGSIILDDTATSEVTCGCKFSDPNVSTDEEYILLASNAKVVAFNTSTLESFDMPLQTGETIPLDSSILQVFNKVIIFRDSQISLENDKFFSPLTISLATRGDIGGTGDAITVVRITTFANHGLNTGDSVDISGLSGTEDPNGQHEVTKISDKVFTYSITTLEAAETYTLSDAKVSPTFLLVANGDYSQPVQISSSITTADGVCTVTATSNHLLKTGNTVVVDDKANSNLENGEEYQVTVTSDTEFTIFVQHANESNTPNVVFERRVSQGLGFTHSPAPNFGAYHNKRLVVPYNYEVSGTSGSSQITDRNIKDEVLISDILDSDTFDQIFAQFRFNAGSADFVVGFQSFANDQLIVFNRNSIHTVFNTINLTSATVRQVTDEVGCLARRSISQIGAEVLFLSDNGVYGISFVDEYNLRGTALPLSEPINKTIQRINKAVADKAVSAYFDNRYYLAVPLNKEVETVDDEGNTVITTELALENNAVIIYNFLNKQWESVDTFGDTNTTFEILDLIVAGKGNNRAVYAINKEGGIHQLDVNENGQDAIISTLGQDTATAVEVDAVARTRQFTIGSIDRKKWNDFEIHAESGEFPTDFSIAGNTENIDEDNIDLKTLHQLNGGSQLEANGDVAIRGRIGNKRAYGLDIEITRITGRPKLRAVKVSGVETFRSTHRAE
jgi:hypothetical protein